MLTHEIYLKDDFIKLGQALKAARVCMSGGESKEVILEGKVKVNGETELRRGRKLFENDRVEIGEHVISIKK